MEFKALITRNITFADESIRINIEGSDNFASFQAKVNEALTFCDYRAHQQNFRLFEDTSLIDKLSEEEKKSLEEAVRLLFPNKNLPRKSQLGSGVKLEFAKLNANNEALTLQLHDFETYDEVLESIKNLWTLLDNRLSTTNERNLKHEEYLRSLDYNTKLKLVMIMDILYGRSSSENVAERLTNKDSSEEYIQEQLKDIVHK